MALYAFDGTGDDDSHAPTTAAGVAKDTNIYRFFSAYQANQPQNNTKYVPGVGTRFGVVGKALGGAFGLGWLLRVAEMYDALSSNFWEHGDRVIDVIGFSRGAAMALDFVNKIATHGLHDPKSDTLIAAPPIRFLALFDVVDAFGIANLGGPINTFDPVHKLALPACVTHCFHAMALDERRPSFVNHRVDGAYEVWFRGAHSDIGGGNDNPRLEYVTLRWMFRKAMLCSLPIIEANINDSAIHPDDAIKPNFFSTVSTFWRTPRPFDRVHYCVDQHPPLPGELLNPNIPPGCPRESPQDEKTLMTPSVSAPVASAGS
jgi:uncharacterized protein (DUF2235 family)